LVSVSDAAPGCGCWSLDALRVENGGPDFFGRFPISDAIHGSLDRACTARFVAATQRIREWTLRRFCPLVRGLDSGLGLGGFWVASARSTPYGVPFGLCRCASHIPHSALHRQGSPNAGRPENTRYRYQSQPRMGSIAKDRGLSRVTDSGGLRFLCSADLPASCPLFVSRHFIRGSLTTD
jgi:hypothetical protein